MTVTTTPAPPRNRLAATPWWGAVLYRGGVVAAGAVLVVVVAAAVLVPFELWRPVVALPVIAVGLALVVRWSAWVPVPEVRAWTAWGTVLVAAGHGLWAALTHAEHVVIRRDAGSYALYTQWISTRHGLPVDASVDALGGAAALADPAFRISSPAFYQVLQGSGTDLTGHVVPQFLPGSPGVWSLGYWAAGWSGMFLAPALVSALAVLAFGGLAARLVRPDAAPLAALLLALTQPVLHAARSTYSEPVALLLLCGAGCLVVDAVRSPGAQARLGLAAGGMLGLTGLVRVDVLREVALLLPAAAVLALRRSPAARPLVTGALAGLGISTGWALINSRPYLGTIAGSLVPLIAGFVLLGAASWWVVSRERRGGLFWLTHPRPSRRAPVVAGAGVVLAGLALAARPLWLIARQDPNDSGSRFVGRLQPGQGLDLDPGRTYAEHSVNWVAWWVGPVALIAALAVYAVLADRFVRWWQSGDPRVPGWFLPAFVGLGSTVLSLYRPGITPDHPWADRRLVTVVLPTVVLGAVAALVAVLGWVRHRWPGRARVLVPLAGVLGVAALVGPALAGTLPVAGDRTERGEPAAQRAVCDALEPDDVVIAVGPRALNEWPQIVRAVCGNPAGAVNVPLERPGELVAAATRAAERVAAAGHRPVFLAADGADVLDRLGLHPAQVVDLETTEDQRLLTRRPYGMQRLDVEVWLARWP